MWLTGRLTPDFTSIANFRRDSGPAIPKCAAGVYEVHRRLAAVRSLIRAPQKRFHTASADADISVLRLRLDAAQV